MNEESNHVSELTPALLAHVARLAHLGLEPADISELSAQLSDILRHVATLQAVNTNGVEPTSHVVAGDNVWREDVVAASWTPAQVLANAPHCQQDMFEVQAVLE